MYGSEADLHETVNKQPAAARLARAAGNEVYGLKEFPAVGPVPVNFTMEKGGSGSHTLNIYYDQDIKYNGRGKYSGGKLL